MSFQSSQDVGVASLFLSAGTVLAEGFLKYFDIFNYTVAFSKSQHGQ